MKNSQKFSTGNKSRAVIILLILLLGTVLMSLCLGAEKINVFRAAAEIVRAEPTAEARILKYVRLPRTCAGLLAGAALAAAGVIIQSVLANSLAAPSTIGVNAGAGLAVAIFTGIFPGAAGFIPLAALLGAFGGTMLVLSVARHSSASRITLVLAGVAISGIFSAGIDAIVSLIPDALSGYSDFRIGGLSGVNMQQLSPAVFIIAAGLIVAFSLRNELDILMLGTEQARTLGLSAEKLQLVFLLTASALAGSAISFSGLIGFVGLLVPHIMRRIVGEESGILLLSSALGGAVLLCLCDLISRIAFAPYELPVGIVMSLLGGPFFLWLIKRRGGRSHD